MLLDDFLVYKAKAIAREQPFQVQIFPHTGVEVTVLDDFSYEHVELMEQTATPPLKIFEAQPCIGKRIVVLNVQIEDDNMLSILITGAGNSLGPGKFSFRGGEGSKMPRRGFWNT